MEEKSILNQQVVKDYLNNLAEAVCINGEALDKYEKVITKQYGDEVYNNMKMFVEEVQEYVKRKNFTNTSKVNLGHLGRNAGISDDVITRIIQHYESMFKKKEPETSGNTNWVIYVLLFLLLVGLIIFITTRESKTPAEYQIIEEESIDDSREKRESESAENLYRKAMTDTSSKSEDLIRAAEMGFAPAQTELGIRYYNGEGFEADESEALRWFRKASEQGDSEARDYISYINGSIIIDDIEYKNEDPSKELISKWKNKYHDKCVEKIKGKYGSYTNADKMAEEEPCLVYLILTCKTLEDKNQDSKYQRQEWFNLYSLMKEEEVYKLYNILYREKSKLAMIEMKYDLTQRRIDRKREVVDE